MVEKTIKFVTVLSILLICNNLVHGQSPCCEGIQLPDNDCLLSWDIFVEYIADTTWLGIYGTFLDPTTIFPVIPQKPEIRWELESNFSVRRVSAFMADSLGECGYANESASGGACSGVSKMEYLQGDSGGLNQRGRVDRFVSPNPEKFVIYSACMGDKAICDGLCKDGFLVVFVKDQRENSTGDIILNEIPWCQIEETLNDCFNISMYDDSYAQVMDWIWAGTECKIGG